MYHGEEQSVPYSTQAKHHKVAAKATVEAVLKHFETRIKALNFPTKLCVVDYGTCDGVLALDVFSKMLDGAKNIEGLDCTFMLNDHDTKHLSLLGRKISEWKLSRRNNIYIFLNVGNMYTRCLPHRSVDVVICTAALHLMDQIPAPCFLPKLLPESDDRELIRKQANTEWTNFLTARCDELKTAGMIVTTLPLDDGSLCHDVSLFLPLMADVWSSMFDDGLITEVEYRSTVVPIYLRTPEEVLAPFHNGAFKGLRLVSSEKITIDHKFKCLDSTGRIDKKASARSIMGNIRSWSRGYIHKCLQGTEANKRRILDIYYDRLNIKALSCSYEDMSFQNMIVVVVKE